MPVSSNNAAITWLILQAYPSGASMRKLSCPVIPGIDTIEY
jgi:hypothetical protein